MVKIFGAPGPDTRDTGALDFFGTPTGPSSSHLFGVDPPARVNLLGTDASGRDLLSRLVFGADGLTLVVSSTDATVRVYGRPEGGYPRVNAGPPPAAPPGK